MPLYAFDLSPEEREERDRLVFECMQSETATAAYMGELIRLRKLYAAVKKMRRLTPSLQAVMKLFRAREHGAQVASEPDRFELQP